MDELEEKINWAVMSHILLGYRFSYVQILTKQVYICAVHTWPSLLQSTNVLELENDKFKKMAYSPPVLKFNMQLCTISNPNMISYHTQPNDQ